MPLKPHPTDPDKMVYVSRQYDLPKEREWVGLTDEELKDIWLDFVTDINALKVVEEKLKEKNT